MIPILAGVLAFGFLSCGKGGPTVAGQARAASLIYTGNLDGEIEPCG